MALSDKVKSNAVIVVDNLKSEDSKANTFSKAVKDLLSKVDVSPRYSLIVIAQRDENLTKASRNLPDIKLIVASSLNVYDILHSTSLVITKDALSVIEKTYLK